MRELSKKTEMDNLKVTATEVCKFSRERFDREVRGLTRDESEAFKFLEDGLFEIISRSENDFSAVSRMAYWIVTNSSVVKEE